MELWHISYSRNILDFLACYRKILQHRVADVVRAMPVEYRKRSNRARGKLSYDAAAVPRVWACGGGLDCGLLRTYRGVAGVVASGARRYPPQAAAPSPGGAGGLPFHTR